MVLTRSKNRNENYGGVAAEVEEPSEHNSSSPSPQPSNSNNKRTAKRQTPCPSLIRETSRGLNTSSKMPFQDSIIGREKELGDLRAALKDLIGKRSSGSIYVSGAPGTGKTACISYTLRDISKDGGCDVFYINSMGLEKPSDIYSEILSTLSGTDFTSKRKISHTGELRKFLAQESSVITVLALDEVDKLETKSRDILYGVFSLPSVSNRTLVLIGISNSLDLTDRLLPKLRMGPSNFVPPTLLHFPPYTKDELIRIIKSRVQEESEAALELCARKVSSISGDARTALDICKLALGKNSQHCRIRSNEKIETGTKPPMSVAEKRTSSCRDVLNVVNEVYSPKLKRTSIALTTQQKLLLAAAMALSTQDNKHFDHNTLLAAYRKASSIAKFAPIDYSEFLSQCDALKSQGIISKTFTGSHQARRNKMCLLVDSESAKSYLDDEGLISQIINAL